MVIGLLKLSIAPLLIIDAAVNCGSLTDPDNGIVNYSSTTYNSTATYTCDPMHVLMLFDQEPRRTCLQNGTWSGRVPFCKECIGGVSGDGMSCLGKYTYVITLCFLLLETTHFVPSRD